MSWAADPFTVIGVPVDASGANAIEAQTLAISDGQVTAAGIVISRVTLESERRAIGLIDIEQDAAAKMIRALEIANEKRSANRYLGDISVAFNSAEVQRYLQSKGLQMISTQARPRLVLPILESAPLWSDNEWHTVWNNAGYDHALTPVIPPNLSQVSDATINKDQANRLDMAALRRLGKRFGVDQILVVKARPSGASVRITAHDIALDTGNKQNLGTMTAPDYYTAAGRVIGAIEQQWKQAALSSAENAESIAISVLYGSHTEWMRLKDAINNSAQIQDARLDAISKDGALMTIVYGGDFAKLKNELAFKGVDIRNEPGMGVVLSRTRRF